MNNKLSIKIEDGSERSLEGFAQIIQGKLWTHYKGQTIVSDLNKGHSKRRGRDGKSNLNQIIAPMPGKITKIAVAVDEEVATGQAIVVMEAMKMEYTLKCDSPALIEKILVSVGDQVPLGHVLVMLKPPS